MKKSYPTIYASYAFGFWSGKLLPRLFNYQSIEQVTKKFTIGFTNTPGPVKPFVYTDKHTGEHLTYLACTPYAMVSG